MTIAATRTREFSISQLVRRAYRRAGLLPEQASPSTAQASDARDELELIIDTLELEGLLARSVVFEYVTLVADTASYTLDDDILDVVGDAMYIQPGEPQEGASGETLVRAVPRDTWHTISAKSASGRPSLYWAERSGAQVQIRFWATPDEAGTVRLQVHRLRADNSSGNATPDVERHWAQYLVYALAHSLAVSNTLPLERCRYLATHAESQLQKCKAKSNYGVARVVHLAHASSRRR